MTRRIPAAPRWIALAALLAWSGAPRLTSAQPAAAPLAEAEALFYQGQELMAAGKLDEACATFARSLLVAPRMSTLLNLANCLEKNGQLASAVRRFAEVEAQLAGALDQDEVALRTLAQQRLAGMRPRLSTLTVRLTGAPPAGLQVQQAAARPAAGEPASRAISGWDTAQPVDGGEYTITASAPGYQPFTKTSTVGAEGDQVVVEFPSLIPVAVADAPPEATLTTSSRPSLVAPIGLGVGALALGGLALGLDLSARGLNDDAQVPDPATYEERVDKWESAKNRRYLAQGVAVAAVGCAGVAVYLLVLRRKERPARTARTLLPSVSTGYAGVQLRGGW